MAKSRKRRGDTPTGSKICEQCGRPFENRKSWAERGIWEEIKYCSKRCRNAAKRARRGGFTPH